MEPWWLTEGILEGPCRQEPESHSIRKGLCPEDLVESVESFFTDENARRLFSDEHWNFTENIFYKGLGLEHERPEWERTARFYQKIRMVDRRKRMHLGVYAQWAPVFMETFFQEMPEARKWVQVDGDGRPIEYLDAWDQYYRWRLCPSWPGFVQFMKRVAETAIKKVGADVVFFDNMGLFENHDSICYCEGCQSGFRDYMKDRYPTAELLYRRTGLRTHDGIRIPRFRPWTDYTLNAHPIHDPLLQECIDYRCRQLAHAWIQVSDHIRRVNPKAAIMGNPGFPRKINERLTCTVDFWLLRETPALYYMENAVRQIGIREKALVSNIRGYRYARALGPNVTFLPCGQSPEPNLTFAECLAFNDGNGIAAGAEPAYMAFFRRYRDRFYRKALPKAETAVLRDDRSLTLRWHETFLAMETAQQHLLCAGIPWMPLWGQQLLDGTLSRYKVLVVPACGCLSDTEIDAIKTFVAGGGTTILCGNAGCYNEYHQTIRSWRFSDLFQESGLDSRGFLMEYDGRGIHPKFGNNSKYAVANFGAGRAVYLPRLGDRKSPVANYKELGGYDEFAYLALGKNRNVLPNAIVKHSPIPLSVRVRGSWTVAAEVLVQDSGRILVHLVNYAKRPVRSGLSLEVNLKGNESAELFVPEKGSESISIRSTVRRGGARIYRIPSFVRYALAIL